MNAFHELVDVVARLRGVGGRLRPCVPVALERAVRKARTRPPGDSALDGVPEALPALLRAHRISERAAVVGFDWSDASQVRAKLDEELAELDAAMDSGDARAIGDELGDVLFTVVNLGRHLPVGAEEALRGATTKFADRFRALERSLAAEDRRVHDVPPAELERRWQSVKREAL